MLPPSLSRAGSHFLWSPSSYKPLCNQTKSIRRVQPWGLVAGLKVCELPGFCMRLSEVPYDRNEAWLIDFSDALNRRRWATAKRAMFWA